MLLQAAAETGEFARLHVKRFSVPVLLLERCILCRFKVIFRRLIQQICFIFSSDCPTLGCIRLFENNKFHLDEETCFIKNNKN